MRHTETLLCGVLAAKDAIFYTQNEHMFKHQNEALPSLTHFHLETPEGPASPPGSSFASILTTGQGPALLSPQFQHHIHLYSHFPQFQPQEKCLSIESPLPMFALIFHRTTCNGHLEAMFQAVCRFASLQSANCWIASVTAY